MTVLEKKVTDVYVVVCLLLLNVSGNLVCVMLNA